MTTVDELMPGQQVVEPMSQQAVTVVGVLQVHPLYPTLRMVIWRMPEGHAIGPWSFDALSGHQHVGDALPSTYTQRRDNLQRALLHPSQWSTPPAKAEFKGIANPSPKQEWLMKHDIDSGGNCTAPGCQYNSDFNPAHNDPDV